MSSICTSTDENQSSLYSEFFNKFCFGIVKFENSRCFSLSTYSMFYIMCIYICKTDNTTKLCSSKCVLNLTIYIFYSENELKVYVCQNSISKLCILYRWVFIYIVNASHYIKYNMLTQLLTILFKYNYIMIY